MATPTEQSMSPEGATGIHGDNQSSSAPQEGSAARVVAPTPVPTPSLPNVVVPQFGSTLNQPFALKLERNNFSLWKTMVSAITRGHRLEGYLLGTTPRPKPLIPDATTETAFRINPGLEQWIVNDQLLL